MGYTGVLKLLQIMTAKGTVRRNETQRAHVYEAGRPAAQTKRQLAEDCCNACSKAPPAS